MSGAAFTNKHTPIQVPYNIHNVLLSVVPSAKYLGVHIDSKISWNTQCSSLCNKANSTLAFLQRNLSGCPQGVKEKSFNTLARPILQYVCSVWDPHKAWQIADLEKNQKAGNQICDRELLPNRRQLKQEPEFPRPNAGQSQAHYPIQS